MAEIKESSFIAGFSTAAVLVSLAAAALGIHTGVKTDNRLHDIQQHNAQIYEDLTTRYTPAELGQLILNDETDTYELHLTPEGKQPQVCEGDYSVTDGVAEITGTIACTTTTEVTEAGGN